MGKTVKWINQAVSSITRIWIPLSFWSYVQTAAWTVSWGHHSVLRITLNNLENTNILWWLTPHRSPVMCTHVYMCTQIHIHTNIHTHICIHVHTYTYAHICLDSRIELRLSLLEESDLTWWAILTSKAVIFKKNPGETASSVRRSPSGMGTWVWVRTWLPKLSPVDFWQWILPAGTWGLQSSPPCLRSPTYYSDFSKTWRSHTTGHMRLTQWETLFRGFSVLIYRCLSMIPTVSLSSCRPSP